MNRTTATAPATDLAARVTAMLAKPAYTVRKMSSGRTFSIRWNVICRTGGRVNVHAHPTRESAQHNADELIVSALVLPHELDPRDYEVRHAEARAAWHAAVNR